MKTSNAIRHLMIASLALMLVGAASANTITGIVTDDSGTAVANISVTASDLLDGRKIGMARTAADGAFSFASLAVGTYLVSADTLNTPWVQKTASPVVAIAEGTEPGAVRIVLVNLSQLNPGSGGSGNVITVASLAASVGALIASVAANQSASDANDAASENSRQLRALGGSLDAVNRRLNEMQNLILVLDRKNDEQAAKLLELEQELADINRQLITIQQDVEDIHFSLFGK